MKRGFVHKGICLLLSAMLCLSGCERAGENTEGVVTIETGVSKIEQLEKQELEAPTSKIHVMIDLNGYDVEEDKNVFFSGVKEQTNFRLVDTKSRRTVFSAEIEPEDVISYGDFTQWNTPGEYYIEIDRLGRSCNFLIEDGVKRQNLTDAIENMTQMSVEESAESLIDFSLSIHILLQAIKCYPDVFETDSTLISWMIKTADNMHSMQAEDGSFFSDYEATAICAGILMMCGEEFGRYDATLAKTFQQSALRAKQWMDQNSGEQKETADFYYMCQYFRANPKAPIYTKQIESYLSEHLELVHTELSAFLGAVLYISSEKNTNRNICTKVMQSFVAKTEDISEATGESTFFVESVGLETIMKHVLLICFIDYITPSREYMDIIENTMHYLTGTNMNNMNYMKELPEWKNLWTGICIYCYSDMNA